MGGNSWSWHSPRVPRPLRALLDRLRPPPGGSPAAAESVAHLASATEIEARLRGEGFDTAAALRCAQAQVAGLLAEVADDARWPRLRELSRRIGDPWNADDWPLGFDPLLLVVPLCKVVDYECARCPVGRAQDSRSCAHPETGVGGLAALIRAGSRDAVRQRLDELSTRLRSLEP